MIPLVAMQFTDEVNWTLSDFLIAGVLLIGTGLLIDQAVRKAKNSRYRKVIILAIVLGFLLIWAELGVGIFGSPLAGS